MKGGGPLHCPAREKQTLKRMQLTALKEEEDPLPSSLEVHGNGETIARKLYAAFSREKKGSVCHI